MTFESTLKCVKDSARAPKRRFLSIIRAKKGHPVNQHSGHGLCHTVFSPKLTRLNSWNRDRGDGCPSSPPTVAVGTRVNLAPPAQIRTGRIAAYGSYRRYLALKRMAGRGCRITALGIHRATSGPKRSQGIRLFWLRRWSARDQCQTTWARKLCRLSMLPGTAW